MLMLNNNAHGYINQSHLNRKDDYLFRISIKGLIRNSNGDVLVVKESGRAWWDLPGGGMDHGEDIKTAISRELNEEVSLKGNFRYRIIATENPHFLEHANVWQVRLIFEVVPENMLFAAGDDGDEVVFIDPKELRNSDILAERRVYEYSSYAPMG